ncbi:MAG TPA: RluA family pseudouridine synthase, partial [Kofleriaceae bacterium]|nr:RluA family pseudouridine synthase [Kofleriaceae bacterium]
GAFFSPSIDAPSSPMSGPLSDRELVVDPPADGQALAAYLRGALGRPWAEIKRLVESGKVFVDGRRAERAGQPVAAGQRVELRMASPRPRDARSEVRIVHEDAQVVVIDKPAGISTVPFEARETGTAMDRLREAWRRQGKAATAVALHIVHRIDRDTSGLVLFAKSKRAEIALAAQFRAHTIERRYRCVAHGEVTFRRVESYLVRDRGDGLRGSTRAARQGKRSVTHVEVLERRARGTVCAVRLETGRTHQIRIHFAEMGHPLIGETVYIRDWLKAGREPIAAERLMLHAEVLGFAHPVSGDRLRFESAPGGATCFTAADVERVAGPMLPA